MVHSSLIYFFRRLQEKRKPSEIQKQLIFQEKRAFSQNLRSPTNWGTKSIMLLPVVDFKKILQKSYKEDIRK
jgi:hypothetical protein